MSDNIHERDMREFAGYTDEWPNRATLISWADEIDRLEAENAKLRAALETYAEHGVRCSSRDYEAAMEGKEYPCDCGLDELLKGGWR